MSESFSGEFFHTSHSEPGTQILTPANTLRGEVAAEVVKVAKVAYRYTEWYSWPTD
jgi:hypothetical protein